MDEEIKLRLTLEGKAAVEIMKKFRAEVEASKTAIKLMSEEAKVSFKETADAMVQVFAAKKWEKFTPFGTQAEISAQISTIKTEISKYRTIVTTAAKEMEQDDKDAFRAYQVIQKQKVDVARASAKQRVAAEKAAAKEQEQFDKKLNAILKGFEEDRLRDSIRSSKLRAAEDRKAALEIIKNNKLAQQRTSALGNAFSKLGGIIKNAFSFFLGGTIFTAVLRLINGFQELIRTGEEYAQSIYRLGVAINQLQRRGFNTTIQEQIALIKELQAEYGVFSQKAIIEATAAVQLLTRNFAFSQEQIENTIKLSMDLALVQGKDVAETAKQLALFYSSGYGEGLQHAGIAVNRLTVVQEANRMGLHKSYMELTEIERATAGYNLVTRQTQDLHQDAMNIQESLIGQIREQRSSIENVTNEIALRALPVELAWLKVKRASIDAIADWLEWDKLYKEALKEEGKSFIPFFRDKEASEKATEQLEKRREEWEKMLSGTLDVKTDLSLDIFGEDGLEKERERLGTSIRELYDDLEELQKDHNEKSEELEKDHIDKLEEIDQDGIQKLVDLWESYQNKLLDIQKDLDQDIADAHTDYARAIEDINRDEQNSLADANRKYREQELKAERDYQEKLRRLREEFLFDLEDALRARDALQVLRLIRRYKLDVEQLQRQNDEERQERLRAYRQELEDIRRQSEEKRQEAYIALQREIEDANLAAERKREDALVSYDQALTDAKEAWQKLIDEENAQYAERQEDLAADLQDRQDKLLEAFGKEIGITGDSLDTVAKLFKSYFGEKGVIPNEIDNYINKISEAAIKTNENIQIMMNSLAQLSATTGIVTTSIPGNPLGVAGGANYTPPSGGYPGGYKGYANGVQNLLLTKPSLFMAGEVPEVMTITPISQLGGKGTGGSATIKIALSDGLVGEIIDNALADVADIMISKG